VGGRGAGDVTGKNHLSFRTAVHIALISSDLKRSRKRLAQRRAENIASIQSQYFEEMTSRRRNSDAGRKQPSFSEFDSVSSHSRRSSEMPHPRSNDFGRSRSASSNSASSASYEPRVSGGTPSEVFAMGMGVGSTGGRSKRLSRMSSGGSVKRLSRMSIVAVTAGPVQALKGVGGLSQKRNSARRGTVRQDSIEILGPKLKAEANKFDKSGRNLAAASRGGEANEEEEKSGSEKGPAEVPTTPSQAGAVRPGDEDPKTHRAASSEPLGSICEVNVQSLDELELMQMIGFGTFGNVKLAKVKSTGQSLAIKMLNKEFIASLRQEEHVCQEASLQRRLSHHPFITTLHASFQDRDHLYLLLDLVNGGDLYRLLHEKERLEDSHVRFYTAQLVNVLTFIHERDIAFRDLNTTNVMIDRFGYLKVVDWGFAKHVPDRTQTFCGTPEYLPPEIVQRKPHTKRVDCWALGVVVFELLVGHTPFVGDDAQNTLEIYHRITEGKIDFPGLVNELPKQVISMLCEVDDLVRPEISSVAPHAWFKDVDTAALLEKRLEAPWLPPVENEFDVSLLQESDDEEEEDEDEGDVEEGESDEDSEEDEDSGEGEVDAYDSDEADELESNEYGEIFKPFRSSSSTVRTNSMQSVGSVGGLGLTTIEDSPDGRSALDEEEEEEGPEGEKDAS